MTLCILFRMQSTTIRVTTATRDAVKALAEVENRTLDEQIALMTRRERQRQMGIELASIEPSETDCAVIASGGRTIDAARG